MNEINKCLYFQELENVLSLVRSEKSELQDQSLMAFEETEEKLHKIQQQETVGLVDQIFCILFYFLFIF